MALMNDLDRRAVFGEFLRNYKVSGHLTKPGVTSAINEADAFIEAQVAPGLKVFTGEFATALDEEKTQLVVLCLLRRAGLLQGTKEDRYGYSNP